jgi:hypothetical protein
MSTATHLLLLLLLLVMLAQVDAALAPFYIRLQLLENLGLYSMPDGEAAGGRGVVGVENKLQCCRASCLWNGHFST